MSLVDRKPNKNGIPYLSKADIEQIAVDFLASYNRPLLEQAQPLDVDDFAENHLGIALDFAELSNNGSVLGMIAFSDCIIETYDPMLHSTRRLSVKAGTAVIDSAVMTEHEYRGRYTIAHECAHWTIHRPVQLIYPNQMQLNLDQTVLDESKSIVCRRSSLQNEEIWPRQIRDWREWQADYLAACLLMPPLKGNYEQWVLFSYLERSPIIDINKTRSALGLSFNAVSNAVKSLQDLGILKQTENVRRNRSFAYEDYLKILRKDT